MVMNNSTYHVYESHEPKLMEYYGTIDSTGAVVNGCTGIRIVPIGPGVVGLVLTDTFNIQPADLANTSMAASANGTGVTLTATCSVTSFPVVLTATPPLNYGAATKPTISAPNTIQFVIYTSQAPNTGGAATPIAMFFSFKIIISTMTLLTRW